MNTENWKTIEDEICEHPGTGQSVCKALIRFKGHAEPRWFGGAGRSKEKALGDIQRKAAGWWEYLKGEQNGGSK